MKLCPQCAERVKTAATICRFCGWKFDQEETHKAVRSQKLVIGTAVFLVIVSFLWIGHDNSSSAPPGIAGDNANEFLGQMATAGRQIDEEDAVKTRLRDPASAEFKHLGRGCGYVNSKNGFGGYGGSIAYIYGTNGVVRFRSDGKEHAFDSVWHLHCELGLTPNS